MGDPRTGSARPRVQFPRRGLGFLRDSRHPEGDPTVGAASPASRGGPPAGGAQASAAAAPQPQRRLSPGRPPSARPLLATWGAAARLPPQRPTLPAGFCSDHARAEAGRTPDVRSSCQDWLQLSPSLRSVAWGSPPPHPSEVWWTLGPGFLPSPHPRGTVDGGRWVVRKISAAACVESLSPPTED